MQLHLHPNVEFCAPFSISQKDGKACARASYNMAIPPFTCKVVPVT